MKLKLLAGAIVTLVLALSPTIANADAVINSSKSGTWFTVYQYKGCDGHRWPLYPGKSATGVKTFRLHGPYSGTQTWYDYYGHEVGFRKVSPYTCWSLNSDFKDVVYIFA